MTVGDKRDRCGWDFREAWRWVVASISLQAKDSFDSRVKYRDLISGQVEVALLRRLSGYVMNCKFVRLRNLSMSKI